MSPFAEIAEQFAPLFIALFAALPVLIVHVRRKSGKIPSQVSEYWLIAYLIVLGLIACAMILVKGMELMPVDNADRSLFLCSILTLACLDQCVSFIPVRIRLQFDLVGLLLYSIILLCAMPVLWQISRHIISSDISNQTGIMHGTEITLMLTMVVLCVVNGFIKKTGYSKTK